MKHDWESVNEGIWGLMREPLRRCIRCRKEQRRVVETWWMRRVGYKWRPLVGRCTGKKTKGART